MCTIKWAALVFASGKKVRRYRMDNDMHTRRCYHISYVNRKYKHISRQPLHTQSNCSNVRRFVSAYYIVRRQSQAVA